MSSGGSAIIANISILVNVEAVLAWSKPSDIAADKKAIFVLQ